jgi:mono/diheme cytochrome c family protein
MLTRVSFSEGTAETTRIATADEPTSVTVNDDGVLAVVCRGDAVLQTFDTALESTGSDIMLHPRGRPFGVVPSPAGFYVSYEATGEVAHVVDGQVDSLWSTIEDGRHLAVLPDGRIAVSRLRSTGAEGTIAVLDPTSGEVTLVPLAYDTQIASDTEIGGVPNYLGPLLVSPTGLDAALPSSQANVGHGLYNNGIVFRPDTQVRAVASWFSLVPGVVERPEERKQFDSRGFTMAGAFSEFGDYLYLAMRGSRAIERYDALTQNQAGVVLDVGYAPDGIALSGSILAVDATLSRELVLFEVGNHEGDFEEVARISTVDAEPLDATLLLGKQLFNDSFDDRLSKDGYMACAHCHLEGDTDNQVWDFTDRGEGLRNTISMLGRAGMGDGPLHWSANFDEVQDFEFDIRGPFGGDGLVNDIALDETLSPLDITLTGASDPLDALAMYIASFVSTRESPYLSEDGTLTPEQAAGKALFESTETECMTCHTGDRFTDSRWESPGVPLVHDVGTITAASGQRLGEALPGIDTPTLRGLWSSAPYLHDGSAHTLEDVLIAKNVNDLHGKTSQLSPTELAQLIAYLLTL